ncbi:hypothetical protein AMTR_s00003p00142200 [Amborella trichopoda]|uniref:Uncharacterized protein n=1 Tax=Amborella trichopoda TaxID=13333 RepID=W1P6B8_AMBTC|nr:hypothetical protein AMTR_s00003p00142200 [Amborella trichopoda]
MSSLLLAYSPPHPTTFNTASSPTTFHAHLCNQRRISNRHTMLSPPPGAHFQAFDTLKHERAPDPLFPIPYPNPLLTLIRRLYQLVDFNNPTPPKADSYLLLWRGSLPQSPSIVKGPCLRYYTHYPCFDSSEY